MMKRRALLASACAMPLAACGNILGPGPSPQIYVLHANFPPARPGPKVAWALMVMRPDTADSLDTVRIPVVKADGTMDFYAGAQFPDRVTSLVQDALVSGFEASGRIDQVSTEQDSLHADYELITEIRDFEAQYQQADSAPTAAVTLSVKLATAHGRQIVASFSSRQSVPAAADTIGDATTALQSALMAAATAVVDWALALPLPASPPAR
ncbi:MAG TPA: ABC-type transport auxiliary lipoprotein family protein [Rhizomicrobium sp.]|jgi:cholesterol transport system auxiliary component|nr:ABC-type transport auxiliary lipoprotein family protein [Rhizomicrobium sp.]